MTLTEVLSDIGSAIREKEGSTELIPATEMASRITAISTEMPTVRVCASTNGAVQIYDRNTGSFVDLTTDGIDMKVSDLFIVGSLVYMISCCILVYWDNGINGEVYTFLYPAFANGASSSDNTVNIYDATGIVGYRDSTRSVTFTEADFSNITKIVVDHTPD